MSGVTGIVKRAGWAVVTTDPRHYWSIELDGLTSRHEDATFWLSADAAVRFIDSRGLGRVCHAKSVAEVEIELPAPQGVNHD